MLASILDDDEVMGDLCDISDKVCSKINPNKKMHADVLLFRIADKMNDYMDDDVDELLECLPDNDSMERTSFSAFANKIMDHLHSSLTYNVACILVVYGMVLSDHFSESLPWYLDKLCDDDERSEQSDSTSLSSDDED